MPIKVIFFDVDGTLVDSNEQHILAWQEVFDAIGSSFDRQTIHDQIGKGSDMLVPTLLPDADEDAPQKLGNAHGRIFKERYLAGVTPFVMARDLLEHVHSNGQQVVLASSASKEELEHYIALLGIADIVAATTTADDVRQTKPAPDIFAVAMTKVAPLRPDEVMVVGDTPYDIEAAAKCGIGAVGLRSGKFSDEALRAAGALAIYDDVAALLADYAGSPLG